MHTKPWPDKEESLPCTKNTEKPRNSTNWRRMHTAPAAEHNEKGANDQEMWHLERALRFSDHAFQLAKEAHSRSAQMETVDVDTL